MYLKKKYIMIMLIFLALISVILATGPLDVKIVPSPREEQALMDLMSLCGAELQSVEVTGWAKIAESQDMSLEGLVNRTANSLKLEENELSMEKWENPYARGVKVQGIMPGGNTCAVLGQTMYSLNGVSVTHLMINLETGAGKAGYYKDKVKQVLAEQSADESVSLTYTGKINWALNQEELSTRAEEVMASAGATIQEKTVKDNLISLTGHSPSLPDGLNYAGKEVNLNVSLRSNLQEQATYVYVASPVIYTEY